MRNQLFKVLATALHRTRGVARFKCIQQRLEEYMRKYVEQKEKLPVEFETLLNGEKINHSGITGAIADILQQAIDKTGQEIRISAWLHHYNRE